MKKSLVLKRRLRLDRWQIALFVLWLAAWLWLLARNPFGAIISLLSFVLISAHLFLKRVTLSPNRVAIWDDSISNRVYPFERILRCSVEDNDDEINVEMALQYLKGPTYAVFGNRPASPPQRLTRVVYFSIETEQLNALASYLSERGVAMETKPARARWKENYLAKRVRSLSERNDLSDEEAAELLREIEEQLMAMNKY